MATDFKQAVQKGMLAARAAEKAKSEVAYVFADMNTQLKEAMDGAYIVIENRFKELKPPTVVTPRRGTSGIGQTNSLLNFFGTSPSKDAIPYEALVLKKGKKSWELAEWKQDSAGFPCRIENKDFNIACENKPALELGFSKLLSSPSVGSILLVASQTPSSTD